MSDTPIGFIGLGIMGGAISNNLLKGGHKVIGYDISNEAMNQFTNNGGQKANSILEVANTATIIFTSLPTEQVLREVFLSQAGICQSSLPNIVMELSTMPLSIKMEIYQEMEKKHKYFMDCPVSGTGAQAKTGDLIVFASGSKSAFEQVKYIYPSMSKAHYYLGECGNGSKMKYLANHLVGIHNAAAGEVFALAGKAGMDLQTVYDVLKDSAGTSKMFSIRGPLMVNNQYDQVTAAVNTFMKDLSIISQFAADLKCPTPLFDLTHQLYYATLNQGLGEADTAVICSTFENMAGVKR